VVIAVCVYSHPINGCQLSSYLPFGFVAAQSGGKNHWDGLFFQYCRQCSGWIVTGFVLLAYLGTEATLLIFSTIGFLFGLFTLKLGNRHFSFRQKLAFGLPLLVITVILFPKFGQLYEVMHTLPVTNSGTNTNDGNTSFVKYQEEGLDGIIVAFHNESKTYNFINGLPHGSRGLHFGHQFEVAEAANYVSTLENVLIIGYGTGDATKTVLKWMMFAKLQLWNSTRI